MDTCPAILDDGYGASGWRRPTEALRRVSGCTRLARGDESAALAFLDETRVRGRNVVVDEKHSALNVHVDDGIVIFRGARARKINAKPRPEELFDIVNGEAARHIARQPLRIPDLAAVLAESTFCIATVFPSVAAAASAASAPVFPSSSLG